MTDPVIQFSNALQATFGPWIGCRSLTARFTVFTSPATVPAPAMAGTSFT